MLLFLSGTHSKWEQRVLPSYLVSAERTEQNWTSTSQDYLSTLKSSRPDIAFLVIRQLDVGAETKSSYLLQPPHGPTVPPDWNWNWNWNWTSTWAWLFASSETTPRQHHYWVLCSLAPLILLPESHSSSCQPRVFNTKTLPHRKISCSAFRALKTLLSLVVFALATQNQLWSFWVMG